MTDRARFEQLAALPRAEASPEERAELAAIIAREPALARELDEVDATDHLLRRAAQPVEMEPVPAPYLVLLEQTRRKALSARLAESATVAFEQAPRRGRSLPTWLALAACLALVVGIAAILVHSHAPASGDVAILTPRGETGFTRPMLSWEARAGQTYDVWILPPNGSLADAKALFLAKSVHPPVEFSALKPGPGLAEGSPPGSTLEPDQDYRLLVCQAGTGRLAGIAVPFHTARDAGPTWPPPSVDAARELARGGRLADALTLLTQLPPAERARPEARDLEKDLRQRLLKVSAPNPAPKP